MVASCDNFEIDFKMIILREEVFFFRISETCCQASQKIHLNS